MIDFATLWLFLVAVLALFLSPGPDMAFVLSHGIVPGPRAGFGSVVRRAWLNNLDQPTRGF